MDVNLSGTICDPMPTLYELSNRLWNGQDKTTDKGCHPFVPLYQIEDVADGVAFYKGFSNLAAVRTDAGLTLIDTGSFHPVAQQRIHETVRGWSAEAPGGQEVDAPRQDDVVAEGQAQAEEQAGAGEREKEVAALMPVQFPRSRSQQARSGRSSRRRRPARGR